VIGVNDAQGVAVVVDVLDVGLHERLLEGLALVAE